MKRIKTTLCFILICILSFGITGCKSIYEQLETSPDGLKYLIRDNQVYICDIPSDLEVLEIPETIADYKVAGLGYIEYNHIYPQYTTLKSLSLRHIIHHSNVEFISCSFPKHDEDTFIDYLPYYNLDENTIKLKGFLTSHLKRTTNIKLDENIKTIIIPENYVSIEANYFACFNNDVVLKTTYESKPNGWKDNFNGSLEVIWNFENS